MAQPQQQASNLKNSAQSKIGKVHDSDFGDMTDQAREKGAEFIAQAKETVSDYVGEGSDAVRGWIKDAGGMITKAEKGVRDNIKRHPLEAVLIGLGIGCAVGFLVNLARRD